MIYYILIVNILAFLLYGIDKYMSIKKKERISEFALLLVSFLMGSVGSILGMTIFHHKTRKLKFWVLNILFTIMWIIYFLFISKKNKTILNYLFIFSKIVI